ncbi:NADPH-dependent FMN reductase [Martelella alba]|uniref:NAD(P)H-dependent oxidoreductase n=1 Tax=Martelella alba TaxID=2590451 RepID=A0ABY2SL53_9HYPH|nr:NADPH-dependent FMN reductase [Martelella alba]TKI06112.1 NAD(P)H-dependent oxidoreductase [Martelella alba]
MTRSFRILGMAGSLRQRSYSKIVLNALAEMLPEGSRLLAGDIGGLPFYDCDLETGLLPESVVQLRREAAASDAVIIVSPEYNHGIPGVLKNALDWLSRPAFKSCMANKPVFFTTLSEGMLGGVRAQSQLRETLASMLCVMQPLPEIAMTHISAKIHEGELTDEATLKLTGQVLHDFLLGIDA